MPSNTPEEKARDKQRAKDRQEELDLQERVRKAVEKHELAERRAAEKRLTGITTVDNA